MLLPQARVPVPRETSFSTIACISFLPNFILFAVIAGNRTSLFAWTNRQVSRNLDISSVSFVCRAIEHHYLSGSIFGSDSFWEMKKKKKTNMHFNRD